MVDAVAVAVLLVLAAGVVALRAVLDGARVGVPASIAVLAPVTEAARLLRTRARVLPVVGGAGLLAATVLRVVALDLPNAVLGFVAADLLWWIAGALLLGRTGLLRYTGRAVAVEVPLLLALAVPSVAASSDPSPGVEAPVAALLTAAGGVLLPWAVAPRDVGSGAGRLLVGAGLAAQPVSAAAVAAALFLPAGPAWLSGGTVALTLLLVLVARRFPTLRPPLVARLSLRVLLPLAAVQLVIVVALALLARLPF
ncbi:hypothetical protein [uncultured Amnibacterium sp.]|uniref:hypothetical protein n=1 Tax=uncultured Amnibacterium sp. TaxID=1631851 RepID=UPI0035C992DF